MVRTGSGRAAAAALFGMAGPLVLARMFTAAVSTCVPLLFARALALSEYGTYKQLFLVAQTLSLVLPFGMAQGLYFFVPREERRRPYVFNALVFLLAAGGLSAALVLGEADRLARLLSNPEVARFRWELALFLVGLLGSLPLEISLTSQGRTRRSALVYLVSDLGRAAVMVVPVLLGYGLHGSMRALAAFSLARLAVTWAVLLQEEGPLWDRHAFLAQISYAAPFGLAVLVARTSRDFHQYAVSGLFSPEMFALYSVACFQLPLVELLYTPTSEVLMVRLGELDKQGRSDQGVLAFQEAAARLALFFAPFCAFLFAAAPEFIGALFGEKFLPAVLVFRIGVLSILWSILPSDGVLRAQHHMRSILLASTIKAVISLPLVYGGVRAFGMPGAIGAYVVAEATGRYLLLRRVPQALSTPGRPLSLRDVIPWGRLARAFAAALCAAAGVFALRAAEGRIQLTGPALLSRALPLALAGIAFAAAYLGMLRLGRPARLEAQ